MGFRTRGRQPSMGHVYSQDERKTKQLCKQVARTVGVVLASECHDEWLQELVVADVQPLAGGTLQVVLLAPDSTRSELEYLERLRQVKGFIRSQVAQAIHRKRTPELAFVVLSGGLHDR